MITLYFFQAAPLNLFAPDVAFLMNTLEHTFPLPETETHKLDVVVEEIAHQTPSTSNATTFVVNNRWLLLGVAAVTGGLIGLAFRNRNRNRNRNR